jgi:aminoglycoside 3-N-acetyltransferase
MPEADVVQNTQKPNTISSFFHDLQILGVNAGDILIVHTSMFQIGWTAGYSNALIEALMECVTPRGTIVMPTQTGDNSDPAQWKNPPVPESWWETIRKERPAYDPRTTPCRGVGIVPETFRSYPNTYRSSHPSCSFAAWGRYAKKITKSHPVWCPFGDDSPLARLYDLNAKILLLGVKHGQNTALHLAEYRSTYPNLTRHLQGAAIRVHGKRQWITWEELEYDSDDFEECGQAYENQIHYSPGRVGNAESHLLPLHPLIDFAISWFSKHRV